MSRIAILSDIHFPEEDPQAIRLALSILPELNLDKIVLLGDIVEFQSFSRHRTKPASRLKTKQDIEAARQGLRNIREAVPNVNIEFITGNHDAHLERYLIDTAPGLFGLEELSLRNLLHLDQFNIQFIDTEKKDKREGKLLFIHGDQPKVGGSYPARNLYMRVGDNFLAGHFHKFDRYFSHKASGKIEGGFINGTLRSRNVDWLKYPQWDLGFSLCQFSHGGFFHIDQILFLKRGTGLWTTVEGREFYQR